LYLLYFLDNASSAIGIRAKDLHLIVVVSLSAHLFIEPPSICAGSAKFAGAVTSYFIVIGAAFPQTKFSGEPPTSG